MALVALLDKEDSAAGRPRLVPAVDRAVRLLRAMGHDHREYGISELARSLSLNKATVRDILLTLCHHGLLERNDANGRYRPGTGLRELGGLWLGEPDLAAAAKPAVRGLMDATGETVFLGVLEGDRIVIVDKEEGPSDMKISSPIGRRLPLMAGSFGKVFLAWRQELVGSLLVGKGLPRYTARTITEPGRFREELRRVRDMGYALDDEEYLEGVRAASAPVFGRGQDLAGAITVVGFKSRMSLEKLGQIAALCLEAAQGVSRLMGAAKEGKG